MKRTAMRRVSTQRRAEGYAAFVRDYLARHTTCEVGPLIRTVDPLWLGCRRTPGGLHHLRKRSAAGALMNPANCRASCNSCNSHIEDIPLLAHEAGLVVREGDPEWDALGARYWRDK